MDRGLTIIEAPLAVETHFSGVELMSEALLRAGLAQRLGARQVLSLPKAHWTQRRDLETGIISPKETAVWLLELADSVVTYRSRYVSRPEWLPVLDLLASGTMTAAGLKKAAVSASVRNRPCLVRRSTMS